MNEYIILQTVAPDYRKKLYKHRKQEFGNSFAVYPGLEYFEPSVKADINIDTQKKLITTFCSKELF